MNIHGQAEERREDNRRNGEVLASLRFALPDPKKRKPVSGITTKVGMRIQ